MSYMMGVPMGPTAPEEDTTQEPMTLDQMCMMLCNALYSIQVQPSVQVTNDSPTTHLVEINFDDLHSDMEDIKSLIRELILSLNAPLQRTVQRDGAGLILSITDRRM